jgi:hypothetical protein
MAHFRFTVRFGVLLAGLVLAFGALAPGIALAAPYKHWAYHEATVTCPGRDPWVAFATVVPLGWELDGPPGTTPDILFGGTATVLVDGVDSGDGWTDPAPRGLAGKLAECVVVRPFDEETVVVFDPAYILLTPH